MSATRAAGRERSRAWRERLPVGLLVLGAAVAGGIAGGFTDLYVYLHGGRTVLAGFPIERSADPVTGLPFTYPPFAAVVMAPWSLLPGWLAASAWAAASVAALAAAVAVVRRALGHPVTARQVALIALGALALEPVGQSLTFGQINLLIMLAVLVDLVPPERRWSGVLVGIAAGLKLTPLVFVVLLVMVGRRRSAVRAAVTFALTVAVGFVLMPRWAAAYWTDGLLDARRVGPPALATNQSVFGTLTRALDGPPSTTLWIAVAGPLAVVALVAGARWWRRGERVLGVCLGAVAMLLASPISWSHHWVWAVPTALVLWERSRRGAVAWTAVFVARPILWPPHGDDRERSWTSIDHVVGNAYVVAGLALATWAVGSLVGTTRVGRLRGRYRRRERATQP